MTIRRVDILSENGGVGKTMLAIRLAQLQARCLDAPVLLIDAGMTGPCLGDILEAGARPTWDSQPNLLHLICGRPEALPDHVADNLPVYVWRQIGLDDPKPLRAHECKNFGSDVLFCPSYAESTLDGIDVSTLYALLGHESVGGWVGHVIDQVIQGVDRLVSERDPDHPLAGVIVDHGSTMGPLQWSTLDECIFGDDAERRTCFMIGPRYADLAAADDLARRFSIRYSRQTETARDRLIWLVNMIPRNYWTDESWRDKIEQCYSTETKTPQASQWYRAALGVRMVDGMNASFSRIEFYPQDRHVELDNDLEPLRKHLFRKDS